MPTEEQYNHHRRISLKNILKQYFILILLSIYLYIVYPIFSLMGIVALVVLPIHLFRTREDEDGMLYYKNGISEYKKQKHDWLIIKSAPAEKKRNYYLMSTVPPIIGALVLLIGHHRPASYVFYVLIMAVWLILLSKLRRSMGLSSLKQGNEAFLAFLQKIGMSYQEKGDELSLAPKLNAGFQKTKITNIVSGHLDLFPFRLFNFYYVWTKKGANLVLMLELSLPKAIPSMLILSRQDEFYQTLTPAKMEADTKVRLEGNFNEHFAVHVQAGAEDEIRQILTPDLMLALIEEMPRFSFLFLDDKLYIELDKYDQGLFSEEYLQEQINKAHLIINKWKESLARL
jgi:hypothetical protein